MSMQGLSSFYFAWPWALTGLLLLPLYWVLFLRYSRKQLSTAYQQSSLALIQKLKAEGGLQRARFRLLMAPVLTSLMLLSLIFGLARPTLSVMVPIQSVEMMLVIDISLSMLAKDLPPTRIQAANRAAAEFVSALPSSVKVGLTYFAGNSYVISPPTRDHGKIKAYLENLKLSDLQPRTELGTAVQTVLMTFQQHQINKVSPLNKTPQRVMILLSDGDSHEGYPWRQAALNALAQSVQIYTVGIGQAEPTTITYQGQIYPVTFSEDTLKEIAKLSHAEYFRVFRSQDFQRVYEQVRNQAIELEERPEEFTVYCLLLTLCLVLGKLAWTMYGQRPWL